MLNKKALAASVSAKPAEYVEDVFSTWLYTGNGSTQTITNGIDLAGEGGLVWFKSRSNVTNNVIFDTARGAGVQIYPNRDSGNTTDSTSLTSFNSSGFSLGNDSGTFPAENVVNESAYTYCSWTFREQPKFFDIVTYTGNDTNRTIAHNLGSVPGMIIVKKTSSPGAGGNWQVYHRSVGNDQYMVLNRTDSAAVDDTRWNNTTPTSSVFSLGTNTTVNADGATYVAYLFAHDAGGFGDAGTDNIISCGSYTGNGTIQSINLGYEAQFVLIKRTNDTANWIVLDVMRGMTLSDNAAILNPNLSSAESTLTAKVYPTATGFELDTNSGTMNDNGSTYIYMAIRRPMKVPTTGTSVFNVSTVGSGTFATNGFPTDLYLSTSRSGGSGRYAWDRLRGGGLLNTNLTNSEGTFNYIPYLTFDNNTQFKQTADGTIDINWYLRRAPSFFDIVCYTGTGSARTVNHNLGVAPELMIIKRRNGSSDNWCVYSASTGNTKYMYLNTTDAAATFNLWNDTTPTSSVFSVSSGVQVNSSAGTYVAYLFATLAGVSKVGSYTGNGSNQTIDCGFTNGARFVLVKATSTTGDWVVLDTARGIVSGNDPFLQLNSTAAEVTNEDIVDPANSGFVVNETTEAINTNGVTYLFYAVA